MNTSFLIMNLALFEPANFRVIYKSKNKEVKISQKENFVLLELCRNHGSVVTRNHLIQCIWHDNDSADAALNKAILQLRRKFEAHGLSDLIDTVPKVGYLMKGNIEVLVSNEHSTQNIRLHIEDNENNHTDTDTLPSKPESKKVRKNIVRATICLILVIVGILSLDRDSDLLEVYQIEHDNNFLYSTSGTPKEPFLPKIDKAIDKHEGLKYSALLSPKILNLILHDKTGVIGQKVFFMDKNVGLSTQLKCIDTFITNHIQPDDFDDTSDSIVFNGMKYNAQMYYAYCENNKASILAELQTKSSIMPNGKDGDHMMLVDSTLRDIHGNIIFKIERYMHHIGWGLQLQRLVQKSIASEKINFDAIHLNVFFAKILAELTKQEIIVEKIPKEENLYVSDAFGGMLFYVKDMKTS